MKNIEMLVDQEEEEVISFTLPPTIGITGEQWITRLEARNFRISGYAKQLLRSPNFKPTVGKIYQVQILKGELFSNENRTTQNINDEAKQRNLIIPNAETACLVRENFTDEEIQMIGLVWLVIMHKPIIDSDGDLELFRVIRNGDGRRLSSYHANPIGGWSRANGFVFIK